MLEILYIIYNNEVVFSKRNIATAIARFGVVGKGNEFKINFKGINVITPRRNSSNEGYRPRKK